MSILDYALKAAKAGWSVFPTEEKLPVATPYGRLKWGSFATTDPAVIRQWYGELCPNATGYGIAAKPSRLLIVDLDQWKPGKKVPEQFGLPEQSNGEDVFMAICESLGVTFPWDTFSVATPSGGTHLYFRDPGAPLRNSSLVTGFIDIRASGGSDGGYVLGPGSVTEAGKYEVLFRNPVLPAPSWLLSLCAPPPEKPRKATSPTSYQGPAKFDGLINTVRYCPEGNRSNAVYWAACVMAKDGGSLSDAIDLLVPAALDCGLTEGETTSTVRSAYRRMGG